MTKDRKAGPLGVVKRLSKRDWVTVQAQGTVPHTSFLSTFGDKNPHLLLPWSQFRWGPPPGPTMVTDLTR